MPVSLAKEAQIRLVFSDFVIKTATHHHVYTAGHRRTSGSVMDTLMPERLWPLVEYIIRLARSCPRNRAAPGTGESTLFGPARRTDDDLPGFTAINRIILAGRLQESCSCPGGAFGGLTRLPPLTIPRYRDIGSRLFRMPELQDLSWLAD